MRPGYIRDIWEKLYVPWRTPCPSRRPPQQERRFNPTSPRRKPGPGASCPFATRETSIIASFATDYLPRGEAALRDVGEKLSVTPANPLSLLDGEASAGVQAGKKSAQNGALLDGFLCSRQTVPRA